MTRFPLSALFTSLVLFVPIPAMAWEPSRFHCVIGPCEGVRKPQVRAWRQRLHPPPPAAVKPPVVVVRAEPRDDLCKPSLTAVGDQALTEDGARTQAQKHWMANVRWRDGEKYMDIGRARIERFMCSRSSVPLTGGVVGQVAPHEHRCEVRARPCRPEADEDGK